MQKRESELKAAAMQELRQQCPNFLVLLQASAGAPDRLIVGAGVTTAWEFKHATPDFIAKDNQELLCMRLDHAGLRTRYVVWQESQVGLAKRTLIVTPRAMHDRTSWQLTPESWCVGHDHRWLAAQIRNAHGI